MHSHISHLLFQELKLKFYQGLGLGIILKYEFEFELYLGQNL